ncbi:hypothetical protein [Hominifimenecus sp. rT4P-3]|uniref:hypothetical protein n=1 Tax=Hominifimenecus sp. rT4P-3 TaxID=3242979 RepID=UPI003DA4DA1D
MAETYGFFDGDTEYGQDELNRYFDNIYRSGVSVEDSGAMTLAVSQLSGAILVNTGFAILKGFWYYNTSAKSLTVTPPTSGSRIDRVVVRLVYASKSISAVVVPGTASAPPELARNSAYYDLSLAQLTVKADGTIAIKDERTDPDLCGAIRPKNLSEFETWFEGLQSTAWRNIYISQDEPENPEAGSILLQITDAAVPPVGV